MEGHVIVSGHMIMLGHMLDQMTGHVTWKVQEDHVIDHVIISHGHVPTSQGHVGESLSLLFDYNLALGLG